MSITKKEQWDLYVDKNTDPYGKACIDVARRAMEILDENKEFDCHELITRADNDTKAGGITGFMAGCVAKIISEVHSRGDEFRKKWNKSYGVTEDKPDGGVVNPAIMIIEN